MMIIAKIHRASLIIFNGEGISPKRNADKMVGIKIPNRLNVVVNGAPFLRILIWISTRAVTKPIPLMMPRKRVIKSPEKITDLSNVAILKVENAIVVIAISVILTFIGGFIPAKIAARKDPVEFLKNQN